MINEETSDHEAYGGEKDEGKTPPYLQRTGELYNNNLRYERSLRRRTKGVISVVDTYGGKRNAQGRRRKRR